MYAEKELKRCLRYLLRLVHEIGEYNSATGELVLAKRPSLDKIKAKLEKIQEKTEEEIKIELARLSKKVGMVKGKRPKAKQKTKITKWLPENAVARADFMELQFLEPTFSVHVSETSQTTEPLH